MLRFVHAILVSLAVWLPAVDCPAQTSGGTLWDFLGIPTNASAQASSNPAIAAAAKAKAAKHEICKKKKAIQYLAGMGCSAEHPEVAAALLAAMGDPEEPVRYEAVKAVLQTADACQSNEQKRESRKALSLGERCHDCKKKIDKAICDCIDRICGKAPPKEHKHKLKKLFGREDCPQEPADCGKGQGSCCTPEIREKLQQLAYGRDERGCFLERSSRVRELAAAALQACSACGGCGCRGDGSFGGIREMPPEENREMGFDSTDQLPNGDCVYESVVVPLPSAVGPTLAEPPAPQAPANEPASEQGLPAPEPLPVPAASLKSAAARLAMAPVAGASVPRIVLPPRPASPATADRPSTIWNPRRPPETLAQAVPLPSAPGVMPVPGIETVRDSLGTMRFGLAVAGLPEPMATRRGMGGRPPRSAPPHSGQTVISMLASDWTFCAAVATVTILAAAAACACFVENRQSGGGTGTSSGSGDPPSSAAPTALA